MSSPPSPHDRIIRVHADITLHPLIQFINSNTRSTSSSIKTRHFSSIFSELSSALRIHQSHGSFLGGIHLELTGEAVTECIGGSEGLVEEDLSLNYTTYCDPRLNEKQALELAFLVAGHYRGQEVL